MTQGDQPKARFVWPPVRPAVQVHTASPHPEPLDDSEPAPAIAVPIPRGFRGSLLEFERTWLGLAKPPLPERMAAAGWAPDAPERYCHRCGTTAGPHDTDGSGCSWCREHKVVWERTIRLGEFKGMLREVIHDVKFSRWRRLGRDIGRMLGQAMDVALEDNGIQRDQAVIVPVPMSLTRRLTRGIDHATVIARGAAEVTGLPLVHALTRRYARPQAGLSATARQSNIAGKFTPIRGVDLSGLTIVLLDDVTTSRATLRAAFRAIALGHKEIGSKTGRPPPRMWAAVVGVTPQPANKPV